MLPAYGSLIVGFICGIVSTVGFVFVTVRTSLSLAMLPVQNENRKVSLFLERIVFQVLRVSALLWPHPVFGNGGFLAMFWEAPQVHHGGGLHPLLLVQPLILAHVDTWTIH